MLYNKGNMAPVINLMKENKITKAGTLRENQNKNYRSRDIRREPKPNLDGKETMRSKNGNKEAQMTVDKLPRPPEQQNKTQ